MSVTVSPQVLQTSVLLNFHFQKQRKPNLSATEKIGVVLRKHNPNLACYRTTEIRFLRKYPLLLCSVLNKYYIAFRSSGQFRILSTISFFNLM